jgi:hypothetical protein
MIGVAELLAIVESDCSFEPVSDILYLARVFFLCALDKEIHCDIISSSTLIRAKKEIQTKKEKPDEKVRSNVCCRHHIDVACILWKSVC